MDMSHTAVAWAKSRHVKSPVQKALLMTLAGMADDAGAVNCDLRALNGLGEGFTPKQVQQAGEALIAGGLAHKVYRPDSYTWHWLLRMAS
jgi:hypothetical protein